MYKVYGDSISGNCYKIKLLLELLQREYEWNHVDILRGDTQAEDFLAINSTGKIPVLITEAGDSLSESNAILNYLAEGTSFLPVGGLARARVLQWQFFEQYSHEPYIAVARYINLYLGLPKERRAEYEAKQDGGHKALAVMDEQLQRSEFLVADTATIADISLYAYTHVAHEGGFDLADYAGINRWLAAVARLPNFVAMA